MSVRSPRVVYGLVAVVLAVAGFVLPRWLADRSGPELGETVVVTPGTTGPTTRPPSTGPGAGQVSPAPVRTAGDDADDDPDGPEDSDDNDSDDDG